MSVRQASKAKKPVTKDELRQLMKQQRGTSKANADRIDSPLARYNALGQLSCVICNTPMKNDKLWNVHLMSKSHKQNVESFKRASQSPAVPPSTSGTKRKPPDNASDSPVPSKLSKDSKRLGLGEYSGSSDEEQDGTADTQTPALPSVPAKTTANSTLPPDFFDSGVTPSGSAEDANKPPPLQSMAEQLPEGFFDDPVQDAKVRKVEYKDKMDDEWELFQRAMKEEAQVSAAIVDEEDEIKIEERNIEEIDEQLQRLAKVTELAKAKEKLMAEEKTSQKTEEDSNSDVDEQDFEEFLDWRSKKAWKS